MADQAEFLKQLMRHQAAIRMFIGALVRDRQDREDLLQDVILVLWEKFDHYDPARPFDAWARGIAANKILQRREKQGRTPTPFPPETVAAILDAFDRRGDGSSEVGDALDDCLQELPRQSYQILMLRYRDALDVKELAPHVNLSAPAAYKTLARLRQRLRECVERRLRVSGEDS